MGTADADDVFGSNDDFGVWDGESSTTNESSLGNGMSAQESMANYDAPASMMNDIYGDVEQNIAAANAAQVDEGLTGLEAVSAVTGGLAVVSSVAAIAAVGTVAAVPLAIATVAFGLVSFFTAPSTLGAILLGLSMVPGGRPIGHIAGQISQATGVANTAATATSR